MRRGVFVGLVVGTLVLACGSSSTTTSSPAPSGPCGELVSARCNKLSECFPVLLRISYKDVNDCIARENEQCVKSINAPSTGLTAAYVSGCASAYSSASCDAILEPIDACKTPAGSLADGAPCGEDAQCQSRACNKSGSSTCGTCGKRAAVGASCADNAKCEDGLVCTLNSACAAPRPEGSDCGVDEPCQSPLQCAIGTATCRAPAGLGAPCADAPCDARKKLDCNSTSKTCTELAVRNPGERCDLPDECAAGSWCKTGARPSGSCEAALAEGAPCSDGARCQAPARCLDGVCTILDPATCK